MKKKEPYIGEPMKSLLQSDVKLKPKNLYQKLLEVRKTVPYIKKGAQGYGYNYTKESQLLGAIRGEMDVQGIWFDMDMIKLETIDLTIKLKDNSLHKTTGIRATFKFTFTDCDSPKDSIVRHQILQDAVSDVKAIGGLETYANKYFIMKFFNIPNDDLDPDAFQTVIEKSNVIKYIDDKQKQSIIELINGDMSLAKDLATKFEVKSPNEITCDEYENVHTFLMLKKLQKENKEKENGKQ
ncbi:MAG: ERF family protein [Bacteroidales bacterium]|jgi:hypothetical protein